MISAKVIAYSKSVDGKELITLQLRYPKFIHGEFMTHRVFSRNASSSRAIPFKKFVEDVEKDMAMPVYWGSNKPGMQAGEEIEDKQRADMIWRLAFGYAEMNARHLHDLGVHKQICNRLLEPFYCINTLVTATEWYNFFELRDHPDAQPEIRCLAVKMKEAITEARPKLLEDGQWHLPYIKDTERDQYDLLTLIKLSVARCARVSYLTHDDKLPEAAKDLALYDRLVGSVPIHASPCEHQATPFYVGAGAARQAWLPYQGNFRGWLQYRKLLEAGINPLKAPFRLTL